MTLDPVNWKSVAFLAGLATVQCGSILTLVKFYELRDQQAAR